MIFQNPAVAKLGTLPAISAKMTTQQDRLECYEKIPSKWSTILISFVGLVLVYFFIPHSSWTFYLGIGMCFLLFFLALTHKGTTEPKLTLDRNIIKTTYGQTYNVKSISNAELLIKGKWTRFKSYYIKLYFKNNNSIEFPVDRLNIKPQDILANILSKLVDE